jgi:hypothetical protein
MLAEGETKSGRGEKRKRARIAFGTSYSFEMAIRLIQTLYHPR